MAATDELGALEPLLAEYEQVEAQMADPRTLADPQLMRRVGRRYAELGRVKAAADRLSAAAGDLQAARELAVEDRSFADEIPALEEEEAAAHEALVKILAPRDPEDAMDVILEIKAGEGGEESALFASDLARMYGRYAEAHGWSVTELSATHTELGGFKDVTLAIRAKGTPAPDEGVWAHLKYEGGVHRVQRVPITESQGRIHTSAVGVFVMPEIEDDDEIVIDPADLRIDVYRSSGPGGQSVNTTDSAPALRHRRVDAEREVAAAEQGGCPACSGLATGGRGASQEGGRGLGPASLAGAYRGPLRTHPHLQLPGEPHRGSPHRLQGPQP